MTEKVTNSKTAAAPPETSAPSAPESWPLSRKRLLLLGGTLGLLCLALGLPGIVGGASADEVAASPSPMPPAPEAAIPEPALSSGELLQMADVALAEERPADALRLLEEGLTRCALDDLDQRARFFQRLVRVQRALGHDGAAELFRRNALRLTQEARGIGFLLDLAAEAGRDGNYPGQRKLLHRYLLLTGGERSEEEAEQAAAYAALAASLAAEWRAARPEKRLTEVPEPPLRFEREP